MNPGKVFFSTAGSHNSLRGIHCSTRNVREWDSIHCNSNRCLLLILVPRSLTELDAASFLGKTHPHDFVISKHLEKVLLFEKGIFRWVYLHFCCGQGSSSSP